MACVIATLAHAALVCKERSGNRLIMIIMVGDSIKRWVLKLGILGALRIRGMIRFTQLGNRVELVVASRRPADAVDALVEAVHRTGGAVGDHALEHEVGDLHVHAAE